MTAHVSIPVWSVIPAAFFGFLGFLQSLSWLKEKAPAAWRWLMGDARHEIRTENAKWAEALTEARRAHDRARHPVGEGPPPASGDGPSNYLDLPEERDWRDIRSG